LDLFEILYSLGVKIVFTMHEYIAICQNFGQMIKTDGRLCDTASPVECSSCFPESTPGMFFLRDRIFKSYLSYCDYFISPSKFLLDRYIAWGLDPAAAEVIENPIAPGFLEDVSKAQTGAVLSPTASRSSKKTALGASVRRKRIGYFGQVNPFKGLKVLLRALSLVPAEIRDQLEIGIHGANLEKQDLTFQNEINALLDQHKDSVTFFGPYSNEYVLALMSTYDWIVVPSTWWENSPVVIQEAHLVGKPVLCSRIGGMAEKVRPGVDGMHFEPGNSADLAQKLSAIVRNGSQVELNTHGHRREHALAAEKHISLYRRVLANQSQLSSVV
jgi:glycosyltransferase involved in cell wall biosynthesis